MRIQANFKLGSASVEINKKPDRCPICLHGIEPVDVPPPWVRRDERVEIVFRCPKEACESYFVARYLPNKNVETQTPRFDFAEAVPLTVETTSHEDRIKNISQNFVAVYREAEEAERRNLKLVCGPGYRKALEFLVKDYVISLNPDKEEEIKNLKLGTCISKYFKDGNDEVHYLRKWEGKDLQDLKNLIELTVHWIAMEKLTEESIKDMPEGKA